MKTDPNAKMQKILEIYDRLPRELRDIAKEEVMVQIRASPGRIDMKTHNGWHEWRGQHDFCPPRRIMVTTTSSTSTTIGGF